MTLQETISKLGNALKRHAPEVLTTLSVAGLGATAYFGSQAGYKAGLHVMAEFSTRVDNTPEEEGIPAPMTAKEIVKETWKFYIPVAIIGTATAVAIIGSNRISNNRQLALISAAAISERALAEYQQKIVETTSKPKAQKVRDEILQDEVTKKGDEIDRMPAPNAGDVYVIESHTKHLFLSNAEKIHRAENDANRESLHDGYVSLNTFLDYLGLPPSPAGDIVGWNNQKPLEVRIGGAAHGEKPVLTIDYLNPPSVTYMNPF